MSKHNAGPWYSAKTGCGQALIIQESTGKSVAVCYDENDGSLIAVAPMLLEGIKNLLARLAEEDGNWTVETVDAWDVVECLIQETENDS